MNNLLRTLTESQVRPVADLRLLLTAVKEARKQSQDAKLTDPFYDSLEGLLTDLKTITIDNRDAEAFLKPVSRAEVPDYYDVIQHPMDFQTMLKKVKQKQYKSKREFKDDLDLIWSNCLTYNANENHPLRPCVFRLRAKAERLLKYITDRKERADPLIPSDLPSPIGGAGTVRPRINGSSSSHYYSSSGDNSNNNNATANGLRVNGSGRSHSRSSSSSTNGKPGGTTPLYAHSSAKASASGSGLGSGLGVGGQQRQRKDKGRARDVPFGDMPAIVRTPEGMGRFAQWDEEVGRVLSPGVGVGKAKAKATSKAETGIGMGMGMGMEGVVMQTQTPTKAEQAVKLEEGAHPPPPPPLTNQVSEGEGGEGVAGLMKELRELLPWSVGGVQFGPELELVEGKEGKQGGGGDAMDVDGAAGAGVSTGVGAGGEAEAEAGDKRKLNVDGTFPTHSTSASDSRPRKKARLALDNEAHEDEVDKEEEREREKEREKDELTQLWWAAAQADVMLGNGLPGIPFGPASSALCEAGASGSGRRGRKGVKEKEKMKMKKEEEKEEELSGLSLPVQMSKIKKSPLSPFKSLRSAPPKSSDLASQSQSQNKSQSQNEDHQQAQNPKALLTLMNSNIKTMRRLRHTHAKFAALNAASAPAAEEEDGVPVAGGVGSGAGGVGAGETITGGAAGMMGSAAGSRVAFADADVDEEVNDRIDEAPWSLSRFGRGAGGGGGAAVGGVGIKPGTGTKGMGMKKGMRKKKDKAPGLGLGGIEIGVQSATDCLHWTTNKVLEHVGFQGTSTVALDVLADVAAEYLQNVGRTIKYLADKFGGSMTPEEIILHTLFESGSSKIQDLERYISDDIERYGARLGELEKKLVSAYRETTAGEVLEDEGLFDEEDAEEPGLLAMGDFADMLGEDYLGLRELGIADEFGLSNLSIPKKLLRGKKGANRPTAAKPTEPPPPYPPPPPFVPLTADKVEDQIGLLKPYYQSRFAQLAASTAPPPPLPPPHMPGGMAPPFPGAPAAGVTPAPGLLPPNTLPSMGQPNPTPSSSSLPQPQPSQSQSQPQPPVIPPDLALPDELPDSTHMKIGPLGNILKAGAGAGAGKKKAKGVPEAGGAPGGAGAGSSAAGPSGAGGRGPGGGGGGGGGLPPGVVLANAAAGAAGNGAAAAGGGNTASPPGKKKKGNVGVGMGNGRKKNMKEGPTSSGPSHPPGPGMSGYGQGQQGGSAAMLPAVVFASA